MKTILLPALDSPAGDFNIHAAIRSHPGACLTSKVGICKLTISAPPPIDTGSNDRRGVRFDAM